MSSEGEVDLELISRVARGDSGPLRLLYERHAGMAFAICMRVLRGRADAEDAVQATFVEVWRRAPQYRREQGSVEAWIFTIARTRAIDLQRTRASQQRVAAQGARDNTQADPETPEDSVSRSRDRVRIEAALQELPTDQRQVVKLAWFEGLSHSDIAKKEGLALGTVKTRARLALAKLGELL